MALREIWLPWTEQPQEAAGVDWGNPLCSGLAHLHAPSLFVDVLSNTQPTTAGARAATRNGIALTGQSTFPNRPLTGGDCTILVFAAPTAEANRRDIYSQALGSGAFTQITLSANANETGAASSGTLTAWVYSSGFLSYYKSFGQINGTARVYVATKAGSNFQLYTDGVSLAADASLGSATSYAAAGQTTTVGNTNSNAVLSASWNRALSAAEVAAVSANPWQLFQPRRIFVPQAGITGLPTLSAATYVPGSLTASGFRPRVTATY